MNFLKLLFSIFLLPFTSYAIGYEPMEQAEAEPIEAPIQAPFQTLLKLSESQRDALVERAVQRIGEISKEMGLEADGKCVPDSFMDKRILNQCVYDKELEFRIQKYGGVFTKSNLTRGITPRFAREMSAKVSDDMLGTTPFFGAVKRNSGTSAELARAVEEFAQIEVERSNLPTTLREAQRTALIRNEAVVKVRYVEDSTFFVGPATVLVDATGEPVVTETGQFIYEGDDFVPDANVQGLNRLKKDPSFEMPEGQTQYGYNYIPELRQERVRKKGIEAHVVDSRSFLCPLTAPNIHDADIVVQLADIDVDDIRATYGDFETGRDYCNALTSGESQPKEVHGEREDGAHSLIVKKRRIAECYLRVDADGDGIREEVFLVLDLDDKKAIFYDYLENHFPKRPFEVIPGIETVPNRWYGIGVIQYLWDQNLYADVQFNRINMKDSQEGRIRFINESGCRELKMGERLEFNTQKFYRAEQGFNGSDTPIVWEVNLGSDVELDENLMATVVQDMTTSFGVISAKDASSADLNNSRTATGVLNMERTANTLTRYTEQAQQVGLEALLRQAVIISLENMPERAMFFSKDGEVLHSINKTEAREIEQDVRLFLTRARSTESLVTNGQAAQIVEKYHALLQQSPHQLKYTRPIYLQQLKALEVPDGDEILPVVDDAFLANWEKQQQAAMQAAAEENKPDVNLNYDNAPPSIQAQIEAEKGYQPASEAERMAKLKAEKPTPTKPQPPKAKA